MFRGRTLAGLLQGSQPYWSKLTISKKLTPLYLTPNQRNVLRITGWAGGASFPEEVSGFFATAFENDKGQVVKITMDPSDMFAHWVARGHKRIVPIYEMHRMTYGGKDFYVIVTDYIEDLPEVPQRVYQRPDGSWSIGDLDTLDYKLILPMAADPFALAWKDSRVGDPNFSFGEKEAKLLKEACVGKNLVSLNQYAQRILTPEDKKRVAALQRKSQAFCLKAGKEIAELATMLVRQGVSLRDLHRENFGFNKNGEWIVRDMGSSDKYGNTPVPELKGLYLANFKGLL